MFSAKGYLAVDLLEFQPFKRIFFAHDSLLYKSHSGADIVIGDFSGNDVLSMTKVSVSTA